jgi:hypothetical protein
VRFYNIVLTDATTGTAIVPSSLKGMGLTSLLSNGQTNPAALNIELDIPVAPFHQPAGQAYVRIWGLGLADIGSAFNLNPNLVKGTPGALISVYGGMAKGLPLANPAQARLLVKGQVLQAFGNWIGTDQSVDIIFTPATGTNDDPMNFVVDWTAGMTLGAALSNTFSTALPTAKQSINISSNLVLNHDEPGYHGTLTQLAAYVYTISRSIIQDPGYAGVTIDYHDGTINVADQTVAPSDVIPIAFQDLVGQPTWIEPNVIQAKAVMRGDIGIQDVVSLPQTLITNSAASYLGFQDKSIFTGNYVVTDVHHYGNFRQPDAASWNTTFNMTPQPKKD